MLMEENGKRTFKFYDLDLERNHVESLPMNWTIVHPLDEKSPLNDYTAEELKLADVELYVSVRGFDDVYSNIVQQRTSYTFEEICLTGSLFRCIMKVRMEKPRWWNCINCMSIRR